MWDLYWFQKGFFFPILVLLMRVSAFMQGNVLDKNNPFKSFQHAQNQSGDCVCLPSCLSVMLSPDHLIVNI